MSVVLAVVAFLAGGYLAVRLLAALYGVIDLAGRLRTSWPGLLAHLVGWSAVAAALAALLGPDHRRALAWGGASLVAWYLAGFALRHLLVRRMPRLPLTPSDGRSHPR